VSAGPGRRSAQLGPVRLWVLLRTTTGGVDVHCCNSLFANAMLPDLILGNLDTRLTRNGSATRVNQTVITMGLFLKSERVKTGSFSATNTFFATSVVRFTRTFPTIIVRILVLRAERPRIGSFSCFRDGTRPPHVLLRRPHDPRRIPCRCTRCYDFCPSKTPMLYDYKCQFCPGINPDNSHPSIQYE
jgi:hypothetical protein